ncbi:hypothetical protein D3P07_03110 [Paenibacillus sp. 1011MAR3C5]|nr:hypothetical protein D3P07_03110 [Paenibacillus sp. 1011MAR3C5]
MQAEKIGLQRPSPAGNSLQAEKIGLQIPSPAGSILQAEKIGLQVPGPAERFCKPRKSAYSVLAQLAQRSESSKNKKAAPKAGYRLH